LRPTLITVAGRSIPAFQAMHYIGILVGLTLGAAVTQQLGADPNRFLLAGFVLFVPAVVGAHLGPDLLSGTARRESWLMPRNGSAIFLGLPPLLLAAPFVIWAVGLPAGVFLDAAAVAVAAGTVFGRIGCLLQGCCCGRPTSGRFGIPLADAYGVHARRLPTQLLDAAWAALLLGAMLVAVGHVPVGACFFAGSILYGSGRLLTDFTRQQRPPASRFSQAQIASLALIAGGGCALVLTMLVT
jgi:phosphatidylglycerol---prolipoprotein diacylglyceryl transferase